MQGRGEDPRDSLTDRDWGLNGARLFFILQAESPKYVCFLGFNLFYCFALHDQLLSIPEKLDYTFKIPKSSRGRDGSVASGGPWRNLPCQVLIPLTHARRLSCSFCIYTSIPRSALDRGMRKSLTGETISWASRLACLM